MGKFLVSLSFRGRAERDPEPKNTDGAKRAKAVFLGSGFMPCGLPRNDKVGRFRQFSQAVIRSGYPIGNLAKTSEIRLSALSAAASGVMPPWMTSSRVVPQTCSLRTWA